VAGRSAHTGSKRKKGINAISRAAVLIQVLHGLPLPLESDADFQFGPSLTITTIHAGEGFSVIPDRCEMNVDIRVTPNVGANELRRLVEQSVEEFDRTSSSPSATTIEWEESWPAFRVPDDDPAIACLRAAAEPIFHRAIPTTVSGPSNIGNYLASLGVAAMAGFGVTYDNVHATDEWCDTASIQPVYEVYRRAVLAFFEEVPATDPT
jgi:succinyl-diaminopimelate desuccinylase